MIRVTKLFVRPEVENTLLRHYAIHDVAQSVLSQAQLASMTKSFDPDIKSNLSRLLTSRGGGDIDQEIANDFHKASTLSWRVEAFISYGDNRTIRALFLFFRKESRDMHYEILLEFGLLNSRLQIVRTGFCGHGPEMS